MMFRKLLSALLAGSIAVSTSLALADFNQAIACGPFFEEAMFSATLHPDLPYKLYTEGELALVQPQFARSYLVVAYRYLTGVKLSPGEKEQALNYWRFRLGNVNYDDSYASSNVWLAERKKAMAGLTTLTKIDRVDVYRNAGNIDDFNPFLNCTDSAFKQAVKTLQARVAKYGAGSPQVQEWLSAQDKVFCHCGDPAYDWRTKITAKEPGFPEALPATASVEDRNERSYQIAAANFYAKNYDVAAKMFQAIADDATSPYQKLAPYLVCRCLVRKATVNTKVADAALLKEARERLLKIDTSDNTGTAADLKAAISDLLQFISLRLDSQQTVASLSERLAKGSDTFYQDLDGYVYLLDSAFQESSEDNATTHKISDSAVAKALRADAMSDWIWTFSSDDKENFDHAISRYQTSKKSGNDTTAWLICVASKLKGNEPASIIDVPEIIAALAAVPQGPAATTAAYQRARLLAATGKSAEAIAVVDAALQSAKAPSAVNKLTTIKMNLATTSEQFMAHAYQSPAMVFAEGEAAVLSELWQKADKKHESGYTHSTPLLRPDAAFTINQRLPLKMFASVAQSNSVPVHLRKDLAQALFVRGVLLRNQAEAARGSDMLKKLSPNLAPLLKGYDQGSKEFSAAYFMLKNPGARPYVTGGVGRVTDYGRIDDYQDNWWDVIKNSKSDDSNAPINSPVPAFVSAADLKGAAADIAAINALGSGSHYLGKTVLDYARTNGTDPRIPEALHLVVKATKFGAADAGTSALSKQAFQLLHQKYKGNVWATKTPYYY